MYTSCATLIWSLSRTSGNAAPTSPRTALTFEDAISIWERPVLEVPSAQGHHGEDRILAIGQCEDRVLTVVFTWRAATRRIISARAARKNERENYQQAIERETEG